MPEGFDPNKVYELVDPDGTVAYRKGADVGKALAQGYRQRDAAEQVAASRAASEEEFFTSPEQQAKAAIGSFAGGASLGITDAIDRATASDAQLAETRLGRKHNERLSTGAGIAGAVLPTLVSGGAGLAGKAASSLPVSAATKAGAAVSKKLGGGIGATGAGMATEGAIVGLGQGIQEVSLSEDPVTVERAIGTIGSNVLFGGATGGGLGIAGKAASKGLGKARAVAVDTAEALKAGKASTSIVDDFDAYRTASSGDNSPWLIAESAETRTALKGTQGSFKRAAGNRAGLEQRPNQLLDGLQREAQAIRTALKEADDGLVTRLAKQEADLAVDLGGKIAEGGADGVLLTGKTKQRYTDWSGVKGPKAGIKVTADEAVKFKAALEAGEVAGKRANALAKMPELLERNEALQARILNAGKPAEMGFVGKMLDKAGTGMAMSAATGLLPGGMIGAVGAMVAPEAVKRVKELVVNRLLKATAESGARSSAALDAFMNVGVRGAKATPVLASKVLTSVSFGEPAKVVKGAPAVKGSELTKAYKAREGELTSQVVAGPDGKLTMSRNARLKLGENLAGVRAADPMLADAMETVAARKVEFLASKLPKRPEIAGMQLGPDRWQPSEMDMRTFARYVAAVEDPGGVEERLISGTVTPEDADAYREVYPERFNDFKRQIVERLPELRESLPYERRVALSIFTGIPVDPAMHPQVLFVLQSMYTDELDTDGGMTPPTAKPSFGSVTKPDPTDAQKRSS